LIQGRSCPPEKPRSARLFSFWQIDSIFKTPCGGSRPRGSILRSGLLALALACSTATQAQDAARLIAANCTNCHGADGASRGGMPNLAGRDKAEIVHMMKEFRNGQRPSTVMQQLAKGYTDAQIESAAAYFSAQKTK
jgi:sulfide dehydrogenase cytochrome subunit